MRLVALVLALGSLTVGCMAQVGDPSTEEAQRPDEIVAVSGTERPIASAVPPSAVPTPTAATPHATTATTSDPIPPSTGGGTTGSTSLAADNPNPSPWDPQKNSGGH